MSKTVKIEARGISRRRFLASAASAWIGALGASLAGWSPLSRSALASEAPKTGGAGRRVVKSEEEWKKLLTAEQYRILRRKGTERPFTGEYVHNKAEGVYLCAACDNELFSSKTKYESGTGWPSFWAPISEDAVLEKDDSSFFMRRVEVVCADCDGHLGHVFTDGPPPTGLRYCINSVALKFEKKALS